MSKIDNSDIKQDIDLTDILPFANQALLTKTINKLADYTDIISEAKLSSSINYNYNLSSDQIKAIIEFLVNSRAVSRIYVIAQKGAKDLDHEYISNIFSNLENFENSSSYLSLRSAMESRLTQQVQQFNINMGTSNVAKAMSVTTLRNHSKLYNEAAKTLSSVSSKVQHGYIAASLHDAYVTFISRMDFWNDKTYSKFFFNEESSGNRNTLLTLPQEKEGVFRINKELNELLDGFDNRQNDGITIREEMSPEDNVSVVLTDVSDQNEVSPSNTPSNIKKKNPSTVNLTNDPTMQTPFGKQYGAKINSIINEICFQAGAQEIDVDAVSSFLCDMYDEFRDNKLFITSEERKKTLIQVVDSILFVDTGIRNFSEIFLYKNRQEVFSKFFQLNSSVIDRFFSTIFGVYFQERFKPFLKFIKTDEMMTFACAFIIKRIYILFGDAITVFGFFLIKAVAEAGKVHIGRT
ncbi:MAG: hypothetical protein FWG13_03295 [Leptospirales bacterium]|nr:hypothetical protein [Leptospirales bacterium]